MATYRTCRDCGANLDPGEPPHGHKQALINGRVKGVEVTVVRLGVDET